MYARVLPVWLALLALHGSTALAQPEQQQPPSDPLLHDRIAEGLYFDDRLWLRGAQIDPQPSGVGALVSLQLSEPARTAHFENGVVDIDAADGQLWVLREVAPSSRRFDILVWSGGAFEQVGRFEDPRDYPIALIARAKQIVIPMSASVRILDKASRNWSVVKLRGTPTLGIDMSVAMVRDDGALYLGANRGEFGGALERIDLTTGAITKLERRDNARLCAGPLNSDCDPVTAVIADPDRPECVLASIGLAHLGYLKGRVVRVCGDTISVAFEKKVVRGTDTVGRPIEMTDPIFDLAPAPHGYWAIGGTNIYRIENGAVSEHPLPKTEAVQGTQLSRELPGTIVVATDINWAASVSGYTPLIVSTEAAQ